MKLQLEACKNCGHGRKFHFLYSFTEDVCLFGRGINSNLVRGNTCTKKCTRYEEKKK